MLGIQKDPMEEYMMKSELKKAQNISGRLSTLLTPSDIGIAMATLTTHVKPIMTYTRLEFLCFAYLIGCVTAMNLKQTLD